MSIHTHTDTHTQPHSHTHVPLSEAIFCEKLQADTRTGSLTEAYTNIETHTEIKTNTATDT